jgi:hypothetical protein
VKGGMEAPDIRRKLEDDENKSRKIANDDSLGMWTLYSLLCIHVLHTSTRGLMSPIMCKILLHEFI